MQTDEKDDVRKMKVYQLATNLFDVEVANLVVIKYNLFKFIEPNEVDALKKSFSELMIQAAELLRNPDLDEIFSGTDTAHAMAQKVMFCELLYEHFVVGAAFRAISDISIISTYLSEYIMGR